MFLRKCLNKQYAAQSRVCFFSRTSFLSGEGTGESEELKVREEMRGGRDNAGGKGGGVFNMGEKSMYI